MTCVKIVVLLVLPSRDTEISHIKVLPPPTHWGIRLKSAWPKSNMSSCRWSKCRGVLINGSTKNHNKYGENSWQSRNGETKCKQSIYQMEPEMKTQTTIRNLCPLPKNRFISKNIYFSLGAAVVGQANFDAPTWDPQLVLKYPTIIDLYKMLNDEIKQRRNVKKKNEKTHNYTTRRL